MTRYAAALILLAGVGMTAASGRRIPALRDEPLESDWRKIADDDLLILQLPADRTVFIRLAPTFAAEHVANIRRLALAHWWDGTRIYRVQDNWVVQWGGATQDKPLPPGIVASPAAELDYPRRPVAHRLSPSDAYSRQSGITPDSWPLAATGNRSWIPHCYGTVGVVHGPAPDTGSGSELFVSIGNTRRIDRAYTVVGRVINGMDSLSSLPRSRAKLGFIETKEAEIPITRVRLASEVPEDERPHFEYREASNTRFGAIISGLLRPEPPRVGLGGADVCDVALEVRATPG